MEVEPPSASKSSHAERGPVRDVVLVHGAYADGSSCIDVIEYLQRAGLTAAAVQNPLVSLADDVAHTRYVLGPSRWGHDACWSLIRRYGCHRGWDGSIGRRAGLHRCPGSRYR